MVFHDASRKLPFWIMVLAGAGSFARAQTASPFVGGAWSGNVTATSATVCIRLNAAALRVRLGVSASPQLTTAAFSAVGITDPAAGNVVALNIGGLLPDTDYFYGVEVAGDLRAEAVSRGRFHTFPAGAGSFKIALAGDADYRDPDQRAFDAILAEQPSLLIFNGDLHYSDVLTSNPDDYRLAYSNLLRQPNEGALFRSVAVAYMWDDHDFAGGNDTDGTAVGSAATRTVYREYVPHYPLPVADGTIGQAFTIGRVRVIMTDLRSAEVPSTLPEAASKTHLGAAQKTWFKQELINARDAGFPLILWVSSVPWIGVQQLGEDSWAGYATERAELANFFRENRIKNLVVFAGDMHALAYDVGTHSDYASGGGAPLVVLHAAPLTRESNVKGGPYTAGPLLGAAQYGLLEVTDTGGPVVQCRFTGKRVGEGAKLILQLNASTAGIDTTFVPVGNPSADRALINISARGVVTATTPTLIVGFVIAGRSPRSLLLRAVGPSLTAFGVTDAIARPVITLYSGSTVIASNDDWSLGDVGRLNDAFNRAGAFHFASNTSRDAALLIALTPGAYTLQATSVGGVPGSLLLEAYEVE